jgi:hypothetical protein
MDNTSTLIYQEAATPQSMRPDNILQYLPAQAR